MRGRRRSKPKPDIDVGNPPMCKRRLWMTATQHTFQRPEDPGKNLHSRRGTKTEFWSNLIEHYVKNADKVAESRAEPAAHHFGTRSGTDLY